MSFFKKIFGGSEGSQQGSSTSASQGPSVQFGRYTDANKPESKLKQWDVAKTHFDKQEYLKCYNAFFDYIKNDAINNVSVSQEGEQVNFAITQGSKIIKGTANKERVEAEVDVATFEKTSLSWMRKLMNMNYGLQYSRFALNDNNICMKFSTSTIDGSPNKLYYSLKELCTKADKQDDALIDEFGMLREVGVESIMDIPEKEKEVKYKYLLKWINDTIVDVKELDEAKFDGAISYLLLAMTYRVDFLLSPEGALMNYLEEINHTYFKKDNKSYIEKNKTMMEGYQKILDKPKEDIIGSFYNVKQTFGVVAAANHKQVADFIYGETSNIKWYKDNNYPKLVKAIYEYMAGYCLFNYGMYQPSIGLMQLFMNVLNHDFFRELGFTNELVLEDGRPNSKAILSQVHNINKAAKRQFRYFDFNTQHLDYRSIEDFAATFMKEIDYLNFSNKPAK